MSRHSASLREPLLASSLYAIARISAFRTSTKISRLLTGNAASIV